MIVSFLRPAGRPPTGQPAVPEEHLAGRAGFLFVRCLCGVCAETLLAGPPLLFFFCKLGSKHFDKPFWLISDTMVSALWIIDHADF